MARHCAFIKADIVKINQTTERWIANTVCTVLSNIRKSSEFFQWKLKPKKAPISRILPFIRIHAFSI